MLHLRKKRVHLTDVAIRSLPLPDKGQKDYFDEALPGFGIRVSQGGTRSFFLFTGKETNRHRTSIGRYGIITLAEARAEAKRLLAEETLGQSKPKSITFSAALQIFEEQKYPRLKARTVKDYKAIFKRHYSKKLGDYKLPDITTEDVTAITDKLVKTPSEQRHALVVGNTFFRWCVRRRFIKHSPLECTETAGFDLAQVLALDLVRCFCSLDCYRRPDPMRRRASEIHDEMEWYRQGADDPHRREWRDDI